MKFGEKPRDYSSSVHDKSKEPLKSVYQYLKTFNYILSCFEGKKVDGEKYGFYLLTNSLLITAQSLRRAVQPSDYNLLETLFRQSAELLFICDLIFDDFENSDLAKIRTSERLKQYTTYCLWSRLKQVDIALDREQYTSKDGATSFSEEEIKVFTKIRSEEFHEIKNLIGSLKLNLEISQLDKRNEDGEKLYTFASVIDSDYSSTSEYIRRTFPPVFANTYSKVSSRIHGTWISIQSDPNHPEIIKSSLSVPVYNDSDSIIGNVQSNLEISCKYVLKCMSYLWPRLVGLSKTNQ